MQLGNSNNNNSYSLLCGSALTEMQQMTEGSFDLIITSPPYNKGTSSGGGVRRNATTSEGHTMWHSKKLAAGYDNFDDALPPAEFAALRRAELVEMWRLLSDTGAIFYNFAPRIQFGVLQTALDFNPGHLLVRQIVIWRKGGGVNFTVNAYKPTHEWLVVFAKPGFRLRDQQASAIGDVWDIAPDRANPHPAPFPVELPRRILATTTGQRVLDPFCGSGSTGVACAVEGRHFTGIDLSPKYIEMARKRIELAQAQLILPLELAI